MGGAVGYSYVKGIQSVYHGFDSINHNINVALKAGDLEAVLNYMNSLQRGAQQRFAKSHAHHALEEIRLQKPRGIRGAFTQLKKSFQGFLEDNELYATDFENASYNARYTESATKWTFTYGDYVEIEKLQIWNSARSDMASSKYFPVKVLEAFQVAY